VTLTFSKLTCPTSVCRRSLPVSLCRLRGPLGALDSDVYWPAQLCCVWPQDLEPTTNGPPITRTVALFIQAPAQDPLVCSSTIQCWLQSWVSCTVVRRCCDCTASSAPTVQWRDNGVATAFSDGGSTGGRGPPTVREFLVINFSVCLVLLKLKNGKRHNQELAKS